MVNDASTVTLVPAGPWHTKGGFQIDGSKVQFWARRPQAIAAAKSIGWPAKAVTTVHTRFQIGYGLLGTFGGLLSRESFTALSTEVR